MMFKIFYSKNGGNFIPFGIAYRYKSFGTAKRELENIRYAYRSNKEIIFKIVKEG